MFRKWISRLTNKMIAKPNVSKRNALKVTNQKHNPIDPVLLSAMLMGNDDSEKESSPRYNETPLASYKSSLSYHDDNNHHSSKSYGGSDSGSDSHSDHSSSDSGSSMGGD